MRSCCNITNCLAIRCLTKCGTSTVSSMSYHILHWLAHRIPIGIIFGHITYSSFSLTIIHYEYVNSVKMTTSSMNWMWQNKINERKKLPYLNDERKKDSRLWTFLVIWTDTIVLPLMAMGIEKCDVWVKVIIEIGVARPLNVNSRLNEALLACMHWILNDIIPFVSSIRFGTKFKYFRIDVYGFFGRFRFESGECQRKRKRATWLERTYIKN